MPATISAEPRRELATRCRQHGDDEERREDDLDDDRCTEAAEAVAVPPVGGEVAALPTVSTAGDPEDDDGAEDPSGDLCPPRPHGMAYRDLVRQQEPERDRRVDVAAADRSDHVGHQQQGEAEGQGDAERVDRVAGEDGAARTDQDEHRRADELGGDDRLVGRDHAPGVGDRLARRHRRRVFRRRHRRRACRRGRWRHSRLHEGGPYPTASVPSVDERSEYTPAERAPATCCLRMTAMGFGGAAPDV